MFWLAFLLALAAPPDSLPTAVRATLDSVTANPQLDAGELGAYVAAIGIRPPQTPADQLFRLTPYDGGARRELYAHNADTSLQPASNCKLFTVAAALDALGPDYRWTTEVRVTRAPRQGMVDNLYLVGGGDPALTFDGLRALAAQVKAAGVASVNGSVVCDGTRYADRWGPGWGEGDKLWYYGPEVWGIALGRNLVDVTVRPGAKVGDAARVDLSVGRGLIGVRNAVVTREPGTKASIDWDHDLSTGELVLTGRVPLDKDADWAQAMAVPSIPHYVAAAFTRELQAVGVDVHGAPRPSGAQQAERALSTASVVLGSLRSQTLAQVMNPLFKRSDNLFAEMFNRELGLHKFGEGSAAAGVRGVMAYLAQIGVDNQHVSLVDGSGLSHRNFVTTRAAVGLLAANATAGTRDAWWRALPIAGVDGTLAGRMKKTRAAGNVHAKTGFIGGVTGLSGYVANQDGDLLAASTIFNHFKGGAGEARAQHDKFFVALADWKR